MNLWWLLLIVPAAILVGALLTLLYLVILWNRGESW
jgi:hypothetical protein